MNPIGSLVRRLGRVLQFTRCGVWIDSSARERAIYFYLFGESGKALAGCFPTRDRLHEVLNRPRHELRLVIFTDDAASAKTLREAGHIANCVDGYQNCRRPSESLHWLMGLTKGQMDHLWPVAIFFNPEFATEFPRSRRFATELGRLLGGRIAGAGFKLPTFIAGEMNVDFKKPFNMIDNFLRPRVHAKALDLYYYGDPDYFDYAQYLTAFPLRNIRPLGWRLPAKEAAQAAHKPNLYVWLKQSLACRELVPALAGMPNRDQYGRIVVYSVDAGLLSGCNVEQMAELDLFLERICREDGLVIADGAAPLLRLLDINRPVALIRNALRPENDSSLLKLAYFKGQERWPVFEKGGELIEALSGRTLEEFWSPYQGKQASIEPGADFHEGFVKDIYMPIWERIQ